MLTKAFIPYKGYYSTPFCRWQGSLANENSIVLGANTSRRWLGEKQWDPKMLDYFILAISIGQKHMFFASPWASALIGAERITGLTVSQACTTSATALYQAGMGVEGGLYKNVYLLATDRTSNGPHTIWPNPMGPGGQVESENWMMDNFGIDPWAKNAMIQTAENVAREAGTSRQQCDEVTVRRYQQYLAAVENDRAFQKRYMFPAEVKIAKNKTTVVDQDEGIRPCTKESLSALKTVFPDGFHTSGSQTYPGDGNAGIVITTRERARELSSDPGIEIQLISYGYGRAPKGYMAMAVVPAAKMALENAGIKVHDVKAIKTHNPFVINDLYFSRQMDVDVMNFNNYGCSLVWGHPQGPTAARGIIEGIEEVAMLGGGYLLWAGCAAGDTGVGVVLKIGN